MLHAYRSRLLRNAGMGNEMSINPRLDPRLAGEIPRYHTWPHLRAQSIAEHSWQLMRIVDELAQAMEKPVPGYVFRYILYHDVGETATGDIPYPVKRDNPKLKDIMDDLETECLRDMGITLPSTSTEWHRLIKCAELIEMWEWGYGELLRGNEFARLVMDRCLSAVRSWYMDEDISKQIYVDRYISKREQMWGTP